MEGHTAPPGPHLVRYPGPTSGTHQKSTAQIFFSATLFFVPYPENDKKIIIFCGFLQPPAADPRSWVGVVGALPAEFTDVKPASAAVLRGCSHVAKATKTVCKSSDTPARALGPAHRWSHAAILAQVWLCLPHSTFAPLLERFLPRFLIILQRFLLILYIFH